MHRLAHLWGFGFVVAGHAIVVLAVLVAVGVVVSPAMLEPQLPGTTLPLRLGLGAIVLLVGLLAGGGLVLAGQLLLALLDQRRVLGRILRELRRRNAAESPARASHGGRVGRRL